MEPAVVQIEGLTRRFGPVTAVTGLELDVSAGQIVGLLGPNGSGKTTTIRMVATLLAPTSGTARVCGFDICSQPALVRACLGYVMQQAPARWNLTVREILEIEAALLHVPPTLIRCAVERVLELVGLEASAGRLFQHLSGGMQKRLDLASGLLHRPRVLILDEPTVGLDVVSRHRVWNAIRALRAEGVAILLATNYLDEADRLCDRVTIIKDGRVVVGGEPDQLKRGIGHDVVAVRTDQPRLLCGVIGGQSWVERSIQLGTEVHVHVRDAAAALPAIVALAAAVGVVLDRVTYQEPSLDEVFALHTGQEYEPNGAVGE